ncbi:MAG TPA: helix-turn-helix transcriptional regulator [Noviherbaspirillum sp.]|jgi:DNA-binding CsgD family transcriptional regulator|uniref:helix-turn-helix transcriptional regulator n=1 Tax=Noviherbaspirillum sp. TaxID=1926288 RepID=UPI002F920E87
MDLSDRSFEHLIGLIYETLESPERWHALYEALAAATDTKSIHVLGLDKRHGTLSYSDGANLPVQGELAYMQHYRFSDPRLAMILERPLFGWVHCHELLDDDYVANSPIYQEFLLPYDRRYLTGCKVVDNAEATVVLAAMRGVAQGPMPPEAVAFLERLLPHFARACRIGVKNFIYSTQALVGHTLVSKLRQPVILISGEGEVVHVNESAQRLLQSTRLARVEAGMLRLPRRQQDELLRKCAELEKALKTGNGRQEGTNGFHSLPVMDEPPQHGADGGKLYAFFTMLAPADVMGSFGLRPIVMLFFYHPESAPAIDASLLYAAFGLTPAECRVATLLAEGLSLKQIADALGTRHDTVRKQLRAVYQKTATNRQPELIRLLLHLPHNAVEG